MTTPVFFFTCAASLLGIVAVGLTVDFITNRIRRARHLRAIERRERDLLKWGIIAYPRRSHYYIPPEELETTGSQFAVGRDCFTDRKGVWRL